MTVKQLSVFIDDRAGSLVRVLDIIKEGGFQILASTLADTQDFSIYRVICTHPSKAFDYLREAGFNVIVSDVIALTVDDEPGAAAKAIKSFSDHGISIRYMYTFLLKGKGILLVRPDDLEKAKETVMLDKLQFASEEDLDLLAR